MKNELRALNPGNQKRKWNDRGASSDKVAFKEPRSVRQKAASQGRLNPVGNVVGLTIAPYNAA